MTKRTSWTKRASAIAPIAVVLVAAGARAVDVPVSYTVDSSVLKQGAPAGTMLTFDLHEDDTCSSPLHSESIAIESVDRIDRPRAFRIKQGPRPPKLAVLTHRLTGVAEASNYYLQVSGNGVSPINNACQVQSAAAGGGASSSDGVVAIDQTRALAGGVTAGDTPGFPVTIDSAGSYRLTGSLDVPDANTIGIEIVADHVTLDLGGFEIACAACGPSPSGTGDGINADGRNNISVANGTIRDVGGHGFIAFDGSLPGTGYEIRNLRVHSVGGIGILAQGGARIADNIIVSTGGAGIQVSSGSVRNNVVRDAGSDGVFCGIACVIEGNSALESGRDGVTCFSAHCVVVENASVTNGRDGIVVTQSVAANNVSADSVDDGLEGGGRSTVIGNAILRNGGDGLVGSLSATTPASYAFNSIQFNGGSDVTGVALEMGENLCGVDLSCP